MKSLFTKNIIYLTVQKKNLLVSLGTIVAIVVVVAIFGASKSPKVTPGQYDAFAQCLTDKEAKMYGAFWCSHCQSQKKMFGTSFEKIKYIECSTPDGNSQLKVCADAKIEGYPTWEFADGTRQSGELSFEVLSQKTGCELSK